MPRATCRCGQILSIPVNGPERVICPKCQSKIRVRKDAPEILAEPAGDFIRFDCPCGRRLKVRATPGGVLPQAGKCPDCGRVVPVPTHSTASSSGVGVGGRSQSDPESPTKEMDDDELAVLDRWSRTHEAKRRPPSPPAPAKRVTQAVLPETESVLLNHDLLPTPTPVPTKVEAGLRVCPRCGRPVHLSAVACRECGSHVPKR